MKKLVLLVTHLAVGVFGFALGIYMLPILTAPEAPDQAQIQNLSSSASFTAQFRRDLEGSDAFHWGEGEVSIGSDFITLVGSLAPGPDYKLYLSPSFVETEADFNRFKQSMVMVGDVKTFDNFAVSVPAGIDPSKYTTAVVWCESFGEFITAARYR